MWGMWERRSGKHHACMRHSQALPTSVPTKSYSQSGGGGLSPDAHAIVVQVYMDGLRLYCSPWFRGASLLHVTLDTSGPLVGGGGSGGGSSSSSTAPQGGVGAVHYSPSLASLAARLAESVQLAVAEVNGLRGLRVRGEGSSRGAGGVRHLVHCAHYCNVCTAMYRALRHCVRRCGFPCLSPPSPVPP